MFLSSCRPEPGLGVPEKQLAVQIYCTSTMCCVVQRRKMSEKCYVTVFAIYEGIDQLSLFFYYVIHTYVKLNDFYEQKIFLELLLSRFNLHVSRRNNLGR